MSLGECMYFPSHFPQRLMAIYTNDSTLGILSYSEDYETWNVTVALCWSWGTK
jgi:hypothetical protein